MLFRRSHQSDPGVELTIHGHPWYKWIDSAIEPSEIKEIVTKFKVLYP